MNFIPYYTVTYAHWITFHSGNSFKIEQILSRKLHAANFRRVDIPVFIRIKLGEFRFKLLDCGYVFAIHRGEVEELRGICSIYFCANCSFVYIYTTIISIIRFYVKYKYATITKISPSMISWIVNIQSQHISRTVPAFGATA